MSSEIQQTNSTTKSTANTKRKSSSKSSGSKSEANGENQDSHIAVSAYYKAQARGFKPGNELADWLAAEAEVTQ